MNSLLRFENIIKSEIINKKILFLILIISMMGILIPNTFSQLTFTHMFGTEGNERVQFKKPTGIALDSEGKIYVADFGNKRIQILDFLGNFDSFIQLEGKPHGIEIAGDKIYVAIWSDDSYIDIFNKNGIKLSSIVGFKEPGDIAIDKDGKIFVTDYGTGEIKIFNAYGNLLRILTTPPTYNNLDVKLTGIALDAFGNIYVADHLNGRIMKLDSFGNFLLELIIPNDKGKKFFKPTNIEINHDGDIFVTDVLNRVIVFNSNGDFRYTFGESGKNAGQFSGPHGITFDDFGHIYVIEFQNHRVQIFNIVDSTQLPQNMTEQEEIYKVVLSKLISWFEYIINYMKSIFNE